MVENLITILPNVFPIVGALFSFVFMVIVLTLLIIALKKNEVGDLFSDSHNGKISITKFWQNVAYAAATVAFLSVNLGNNAGFPVEAVWVIYLGAVASNAILSKWISAKYSGPRNDRNDEIQPPPYGGGGYYGYRQMPPQIYTRGVPGEESRITPDSPD